MKIIFMGTPEFAVASLDALINAGNEIVAVVTAPDKPAGRGQQLAQSAVKVYAVKHELPVLQPLKFKDETFLAQLKSFHADLQIVVAFRMLPEVVWNMPRFGTINLHASLLPQYRGAAPINWAIINGEKHTGVTTFFLKQEIDTGDVIMMDKIAIAENDNAGIVHDKLMLVGADLLVRTVKSLAGGSLQATDQEQLSVDIEDIELKYAPKIFKEDCQINWMQPAETVYNFIRGLSPYPTAYTFFNGKILKIFSVEKEVKEPGISAGGFLTDHKSVFKFACTDGFICLKEVQLEGKKRMLIADFLRGVKL